MQVCSGGLESREGFTKAERRERHPSHLDVVHWDLELLRKHRQGIAVDARQDAASHFRHGFHPTHLPAAQDQSWSLLRLRFGLDQV